ncbi:MAG: hypothetical protein PHY12_08730 [Eubacteriales bacterium]|nr:hypothetical protein [Eubacteriales bacterium]
MKTWQPGDALTPRDEALLTPLRQKARELGRTPTVGEVPQAAALKARFRLWKHAVLAAGLPALNDPAQTRLREKEKR